MDNMKDSHFLFVLIMSVISNVAFHSARNVGMSYLDFFLPNRIPLKFWLLNMHKFTTAISSRCGEVWCQANMVAPRELYTVHVEHLWTIVCFKYKYFASNFEWNAANAPHKYKTQSPVCEFVCIKVFVHINILTTSNSPGVCCVLNPPVFCSSLGSVTVLWPAPPCMVCVCADCVNVQRLRPRLSYSWRTSWERRSWSWLISDWRR